MKNKSLRMYLAVGIAILFLGVCIVPIVAVDNVKKSCFSVSNGNTLYVGGTGEGNYTSIQGAIDDAVDGDTVFVYDDSSPYYEKYPIRINKSDFSLIGENRETTIIDGNEENRIIISISGRGIIDVNDVKISGFTIQNTGVGDWEQNKDGIYKDSEVRNVTIINNIFKNCVVGIHFRGEGAKNDIYLIKENIFLWDANESINVYGIANFVYECRIINNTFRNLDIAIDNTGSLVDFSGNSFICNIIGILHYPIGVFLCKIYRNNFIDNRFHIIDSFIDLFNKYENNYWDDWIGLKFPKLDFLPYIGISIYMPWIDRNPAKEPYDIGV
jgi:hypothetical protein